jgi:ABC-2 type transport system ATP-binding protein
LKGLTLAEAKLRSEAWLKTFDLQSWKNKKVEELSKGMQQKVQFIITVLHKPRLLILDEPFTGFDPINAELIKNEIKAMKSTGTTILYSTHRMESVEEMCDHICLINQSKKILDGSVKEIKAANSKNQFEMVFEGTAPLWVNTISNEITEDGNEKIVFTVENMNWAETIKRLANEVNIWSFREIVPTIHQIFIDKVQEVNHA